MITSEELKTIEQRLNATQPGPWKAYIEGRDHHCGSDFIMTGKEDLEIIGATVADYDFIANAKKDVEVLLTEIRLLRELV